jgi:hypothetical protein
MKLAIRTGSVGVAGALVVAIGSLAGCSSSPGTSGGGEPSPVPTEVNSLSSDPKEVGSISAFDETVTFYTVTQDGRTQIAMRETGSAFGPQAVVPGLLAQHLTTQEVYLALAPPGATAPAELVAAQADEAAAAGRSAEVRLVTVDPTAFAQKTAAACANFLTNTYGPPSGHYWDVYGEQQYVNQYASMQMGFCPNNRVYNWVLIGACNEISNTVGIYAYYKYGSNCTYYQLNGGITVNPYGWVYWYTQNGNGAAYVIGAVSGPIQPQNNYDLVMAYALPYR